MRITLSDDGWLDIAPSGKMVALRSLDLYDQVGVDVLGRLREFNKARNICASRFPDGLTQ